MNDARHMGMWRSVRIPRTLLPLLIFLMLSLTGCLTRGSGADSSTTGAADEPGSTVADQAPTRNYIFDTPEHSVVETPWFTVSSVILQVQRTQPETIIVIPPDSRTQRFLALRPGSIHPTTTIPGNRFLFNLGIITDGDTPFTPAREQSRYPERYE